MELLDHYFDLQAQIFEYFGYVEDWRVLPLDDCRDFYWRLDGEGPGTVGFARTEGDLKMEADSNEYYENDIYTQRHLPQWVYRGVDYTLVVVDTHTDGNQLLQVFSNALERP